MRTPFPPNAFLTATDSTDLVSSFPYTVKVFLENLNGSFSEIVPSTSTSSGIRLITDSAAYSSDEILIIPETLTHCNPIIDEHSSDLLLAQTAHTQSLILQKINQMIAVRLNPRNMTIRTNLISPISLLILKTRWFLRMKFIPQSLIKLSMLQEPPQHSLPNLIFSALHWNQWSTASIPWHPVYSKQVSLSLSFIPYFCCFKVNA